MSVLDGPGEGTWSVFAMQVVEERDRLRERVAELESQLEALVKARPKPEPPKMDPWTDEERAAYLDCPECGEPAIPASSVDRKNGRPVFGWTENDGAVCPGCKANLIAFITGDENGDFFEARIHARGELADQEDDGEEDGA